MWSLLWTVSLLFNWPAALSPPSLVPSDVMAASMGASSLDPSAADLDNDPGHAPFELRVAGEKIPFSVMAVFVLPGEALPIEVPDLGSGFAVRADAGTLESAGRNRWEWRAPFSSGVYPVRVVRGDHESVTLNVFVMVPYDRMKRGRLGSYSIGQYPRPSPRQGSTYDRPRGFVKVTAENDTTRVAPHFRLSQFLCKGGKAYPKYVVLQPSLIVKLERLLAMAHDHGVEASTFHLMSAYRTPSYNRRIGNTTSFSRHHYGDAADIFVDEHPADGRMDDLNGDGRQTTADARVLSGWAEQMDRETEDLVGGLSAYGSTDSHGPFVHVDARGYAARW